MIMNKGANKNKSDMDIQKILKQSWIKNLQFRKCRSIEENINAFIYLLWMKYFYLNIERRNIPVELANTDCLVPFEVILVIKENKLYDSGKKGSGEQQSMLPEPNQDI